MFRICCLLMTIQFSMESATHRGTIELVRQSDMHTLNTQRPVTEGQRRELDITVYRQDGPLVVVERPTQSQVRSPIPLSVRFEPRDTPIDLSTLRVTVRKRIMRATYSMALDVTDRLKPYISDSGISASGVIMPAGRYLIGLTLKDQEGRESRGSLQLVVE